MAAVKTIPGLFVTVPNLVVRSVVRESMPEFSLEPIPPLNSSSENITERTKS